MPSTSSKAAKKISGENRIDKFLKETRKVLSTTHNVLIEVIIVLGQIGVIAKILTHEGLLPGLI